MRKKIIIFSLSVTTLSGIRPITAHDKIQKKSKCSIVHQEQLQKNYQAILKYYENKKYSKAAALIEEVLPSFSGKKELSVLQLYQAYCSYYNGNYLVSADQFKTFYKRYPKHPAKEEAMFMHGHSLYYSMPDIRLDQNDTIHAIKALQKYLNNFPIGKYRACVLECLEKLNDNLMKKDFESVVFYYDSGRYNASLISLENFQKEYPNSSLEEEACYLKAKIQYELAQEKNRETKNKQLQIAITYCNNFLSQYPNSSKVQDIKKLIIKLSSSNLDYTLKLEKLKNNNDD